jgi:hypothetical protein
MRPALTSHYNVYLNTAELLSENEKSKEGIRNFFDSRQANIEEEILALSCSEASLPGSSLATHEINNDFTGVTERHVYRRQYDDRIDFTFYVDHDHKVIKFFETWMSWAVGETQLTEQSNLNYSYRVRFPKGYRCNIFVQKFEKDYTNYSEYTFIGAYPISIASMPISYDSSQLLKCTVSFSYIRYFMNNKKTANLNEAKVIGGSVTGPNEYEYQLQAVPGQFTVPPGGGGAIDLLGGLGGIGIRNLTNGER